MCARVDVLRTAKMLSTYPTTLHNCPSPPKKNTVTNVSISLFIHRCNYPPTHLPLDMPESSLAMGDSAVTVEVEAVAAGTAARFGSYVV